MTTERNDNPNPSAGLDPAEVERHQRQAGDMHIGNAIDRMGSVAWLIEHGLATPRQQPMPPRPIGPATIKLASTGDWERPDLDANPPAAPFPLDVLPDGLAGLAREVAEVFPCPPDFLTVPALVIAGAGIGRSLALKVKPSWIEVPLLFAATIGPPGSAKSPILKLISTPVYKLGSELMLDYQIQVDAAKERKRQAEIKRKAIGRTVIDRDEDDTPKVARIVMGDATCEAIARILAENPRGPVMIHDELSGWLNGMNQYKGGNGNDRQFWLKMWTGAPIYIDRVGNENKVPIVVPHPFCSVVGPLTPDLLDQLAEDERDDGFIDRMLFSYPDHVPIRWSWRSVDPAKIEAWDRAFRLLWSRPLQEDRGGRDCPAFIAFDRDALKAFAEWYDAHCAETEQPDFPAHLKGPWAKYRGYCARLILIIDQLHWAYRPDADPHKPVDDIGVESVRRGIALIDYFKAHFRRTVAALRPGQADNPDARAILDWAIKRGKPTFKEVEASSNFRRRFSDRPDELPKALQWLTSRNAIRRSLPAGPSGQGRKASVGYLLNPFLAPERAGNAGYSQGDT